MDNRINEILKMAHGLNTYAQYDTDLRNCLDCALRQYYKPTEIAQLCTMFDISRIELISSLVDLYKERYK